MWTWNKANRGQFANINRPISGPTHDKDLLAGRHPLQLYSLASPNGVKVTMLKELLALGHTAAEYDAWLIKIGDGDQFGSGFVTINPNSKRPALLTLLLLRWNGRTFSYASSSSVEGVREGAQLQRSAGSLSITSRSPFSELCGKLGDGVRRAA